MCYDYNDAANYTASREKLLMYFCLWLCQLLWDMAIFEQKHFTR